MKLPKFWKEIPNFRKIPQIFVEIPKVGGNSPNFLGQKSPNFTESSGIGGKFPKSEEKRKNLGGAKPQILVKFPQFWEEIPNFLQFPPNFWSKIPNFQPKFLQFGDKIPQFHCKCPNLGEKIPKFREKNWGKILNFMEILPNLGGTPQICLKIPKSAEIAPNLWAQNPQSGLKSQQFGAKTQI